MRASVFQPYEDPITQEAVSMDVPNTQERTEADVKEDTSSVWWLFGVIFLYLFWGWFQNKDSLKESLKPSNIKFNLHTIIGVGLSAVVYFNVMVVVLTKLGALKIPLISWLSKKLLPLHHI
jgi:hypothetical protein